MPRNQGDQTGLAGHHQESVLQDLDVEAILPTTPILRAVEPDIVDPGRKAAHMHRAVHLCGSRSMILCVWRALATVIVAAIVLPSLIAGLEIALGSQMYLLSDEVSFRGAFSRFPNDLVNGLTPGKLKRLGQEAEILEVYNDGTVTCRFDDGVQHDVPVEALSTPSHTAVALVASAIDADSSCLPPHGAFARFERSHIGLSMLFPINKPAALVFAEPSAKVATGLVPIRLLLHLNASLTALHLNENVGDVELTVYDKFNNSLALDKTCGCTQCTLELVTPGTYSLEALLLLRTLANTEPIMLHEVYTFEVVETPTRVVPPPPTFIDNALDCTDVTPLWNMEYMDWERPAPRSTNLSHDCERFHSIADSAEDWSWEGEGDKVRTRAQLWIHRSMELVHAGEMFHPWVFLRENCGLPQPWGGKVTGYIAQIHNALIDPWGNVWKDHRLLVASYGHGLPADAIPTDASQPIEPWRNALPFDLEPPQIVIYEQKVLNLHWPTHAHHFGHWPLYVLTRLLPAVECGLVSDPELRIAMPLPEEPFGTELLQIVGIDPKMLLPRSCYHSACAASPSWSFVSAATVNLTSHSSTKWRNPPREDIIRLRSLVLQKFGGSHERKKRPV